MIGARGVRRWTAAASILAAAAGCASAPTASTAPAGCVGLSPPRLISAGPVPLPPTYVSARVGTDVLEEIVIERDGTVRQTRFLSATVPPLAPFAQVSLEKSKYFPAEIDGHPVAVRGTIMVPIGMLHAPPKNWAYDTLSVFVPGGSSREALWQLAGSVDRVIVAAHVGTAFAHETAVVAVSPGGAEKTLLAIPASSAAVDARETVKTGRFLEGAGDYRVELRAGGKVLASTTVTIGAGFETAIVNACEPFPGPEKTGPGH